ncbi:MAG TPA: hypothetical protein VHG08_09585 [Longimicrobium sp.]|nr:hypothetical protein [Longimicrobium sp.]
MAARSDRAGTPLAPVDGWPAALRPARPWRRRSPHHPWCGPEPVLVYDDGYRHGLGSRHSASPGR